MKKLQKKTCENCAASLVTCQNNDGGDDEAHVEKDDENPSSYSTKEKFHAGDCKDCDGADICQKRCEEALAYVREATAMEALVKEAYSTNPEHIAKKSVAKEVPYDAIANETGPQEPVANHAVNIDVDETRSKVTVAMNDDNTMDVDTTEVGECETCGAPKTSEEDNWDVYVFNDAEESPEAFGQLAIGTAGK